MVKLKHSYINIGDMNDQSNLKTEFQFILMKYKIYICI